MAKATISLTRDLTEAKIAFRENMRYYKHYIEKPIEPVFNTYGVKNLDASKLKKFAENGMHAEAHKYLLTDGFLPDIGIGMCNVILAEYMKFHQYYKEIKQYQSPPKEPVMNNYDGTVDVDFLKTCAINNTNELALDYISKFKESSVDKFSLIGLEYSTFRLYIQASKQYELSNPVSSANVDYVDDMLSAVAHSTNHEHSSLSGALDTDVESD